MASNFFGEIFRITTFGESHGPAIGVVIDGCPAGLMISKEDIDKELIFRRPGNNAHTSPRKEEDFVQILSGIFEGKTTGSPIALLIKNQDAQSDQYETFKNLYRPGHANFTYLEKYNIFDYRGGGRSSARETAARVAAGAIAKKLIAHFGIECVAFVSEVGGIKIPSQNFSNLKELKERTHTSPIFWPDPKTEVLILEKIEKIKQEKDSLGGIITCIAHVPAGLGDPVYNKLEALLACAMISIPATKGFEIGSGFEAARMKGSEHNDVFDLDSEGNVHTATNHAGGTLGGISTGSPLVFNVAFKPTSSIKKDQETISVDKKRSILQLPDSARHDPCVAIRGTPVVEAMAALILADRVLANRLVRV
jgi:chorismate synthase